ncbi:MAG TPA: gluconate:H+ symporter [Methylomirabilota bacterium]|nr:gluconate:H+ symporter [Methylomirabilota bacterium]
MPAPTPDPFLLGHVLAAIAGLILLITVARLHAVPALILASAYVGMTGGLSPARLVNAFQEGVGSTLGFIAVVVGLGVMLGRLLTESGGAEVIAERFLAWFGQSRMTWAMTLIGLVVGLPVFFGVGLVLLVPVLIAVAQSTRLPVIQLGIPMVAGLSVAHGLVPPHPGPMVAIEKLQADTGRTILLSLCVALPTAVITGPLFPRRLLHEIGSSAISGGTSVATSSRPPNRAGLGLTLLTMLLPVLLMLGASAARLTLPAGHPALPWAEFVGAPLVALLCGMLFSLVAFGHACGFSRQALLRFTEESLAPAAGIILVVGAGGGFSKVLDASGADDAIASAVRPLPLSPLILGWLVAALVRTAVGSATVAITLSSAIMAPIAASQPGLDAELLVIAMGAGSLFLSHVNDGGFWLVKEYLGLTVSETLRTWTVLETSISVTALLFTLLLEFLV